MADRVICPACKGKRWWVEGGRFGTCARCDGKGLVEPYPPPDVPDDINDPNTQARFAHDGVPVDDGGVPLPASEPGPPQRCDLCGTLAEAPTVGALGTQGKSWDLVSCAECYRMQFTDRDEYWRRVHAFVDKSLAAGGGTDDG